MITCPSCTRLVRDHEPACPFCGAKDLPAPSRRPTLGRGTRSALLVSAAVALGGPVDACKHIFGADTTPPAPVYGGPPPTLAVPAYGIAPPPPTPPVDAGAAADAGAADAAHPDAGPRPHITMYGAPPHHPK